MMSYYVYDEWQWNNHLQLVKKSPNMVTIKKAIREWRNDRGVVLHVVKANHAYAAKGIIRIKNLGWSRDRLPSSYKGQYIQGIVY